PKNQEVYIRFPPFSISIRYTDIQKIKMNLNKMFCHNDCSLKTRSCRKFVLKPALMSGLIKSSIARKVVMALSGLFLVVFLTQHFTINITSVIDPETFNSWSHFMGYNPLVQFVLQPILIAGVIVHFIMGFTLE